jgi:hypothetical protein
VKRPNRKVTGVSLSYRCETCEAEPLWTLTRQGDVLRTWACAEHLSPILLGMQRDFEVTQIAVILTSKAHEWAEIRDSLDRISPPPDRQ